jgi:tetratricopeptide (TPR) repeat protein
VGTFVTVLVIAGFPFVLVLSWLLEFRDGRARLDTGPDGRHPRRRFSRAYVSVVGALAISGLAVFVYDRYVGLPDAELLSGEMDAEPAELLQIEKNSIAVLRFLNIDGSDAAEVFASGFAEGMITRLARLPSLLVASRSDAWSLGTSSTSSDVRRRLRVAYFVEGSVQLIAERLRVNVKLIDSATGFQLTTRTFEEPIENFNAVQRELIDLTIANLRLALPPETNDVLESLEEDTELDAYILYRQGREVFEQPHTASSLSESIQLFEEAVALDPDFASAYAGICRTSVELYLSTSDSGYIDAAETACARALRSNSRLPVVYTAMGDLYANTGRLGAAEQAYQTALEIDTQDVHAMGGLADVLRQSQRYDEAESLLVDAVGKQPGNWRTINGLGNFLFSQGRYDEAADVYRQVVVLDPENFQVLSNLGTALCLAGEFEAGRQVLEEALEIQPNDNSYSNLGIVYYYLGNFDRSVAMHRRAAELAPGRAISWLNLGDALYLAGDEAASAEAFERARELTDQTLSVNAADAEAIVTRAWTQHMLGDSEAASASVAQALEIDPGDPYSYYYDALLKYRSGDVDAALSSLEKALELGYPANFLVAEPYLGELRADSRFHVMLANSFQ